MDHAMDEVATQPEAWLEAAALAATGDVALTLPDVGERVAVIGFGACLRAGRAYAALRATRGHGETTALVPSEVGEDPARFDRFVVLTTNGERDEIVETIERNREFAVLTTAVTAAPGSRVAGLAGHAIVLEGVDEPSGLPTRFASTALALLRTHVGDHLAGVAREARRAIAGPDDAPTDRPMHVAADGWAAPVAEEIAWWLREVGGWEATAGADAPAGAVSWSLHRDPMVELVAAQRVALRRPRGLQHQRRRR